MELAAGTQVTPSLRLLRPLGEGAMGSVWVAEHDDFDGHVAVKFIAAKRSRDPETVARFNREAASAARIRNAHVVKIHEHGTTTDGTPYLVMELLDGETLGERLNRLGTVSLQETVEVLKQVGDALDVAHGLGIVHRDIKPDNLFLVGRDFGLVKVLDFGAAKQWQDQDDGLTKTGVMVGTPEYMSPEQVLGSKDVDHRSDLWALAAVVYRCLVGTVPFRADAPPALCFAICQGEFEPLAGTTAPLELEPWFGHVFAAAKDKRFSTAREMAVSFQRALAEFSVPEWPQPEVRSSLDWDDATELLQGDALKAQLLARRQAAAESHPGSTAAPSGSGDSSPETGDPLGSTVDLMAETVDRALIGAAPSGPGGDGPAGDDDSSHALERMLAEALAPAATPSAPGASSPGVTPSSPQADSGSREWPVAAEPEPSASRYDAIAGDGPLPPAPAVAPAAGQADSGAGRVGQVILLGVVILAIVAVAAFGVWRLGLFGHRGSEGPTAAPQPSAPAASAAGTATTTASAASPTAGAGAASSSAEGDQSGAGGDIVDDTYGYLTVICRPDCSQVLLGNQALGRTPIRKREVPVGAHVMSLIGPNLQQQNLTIEISPGQHVVKRTLMRPTGAAATGSAAPPPPATGSSPPSPPDGAGTSAPTAAKPVAPKVDENVGF